MLLFVLVLMFVWLMIVSIGFYDYFPDAAAAKKFVEFHA